jgi:peptide-methionine (S)-S-oxide reductase
MTIRHALLGLATAMTLTLAPAGLGARAADTETAIFAGGCFWCVESDFDHVKGVSRTTSGYIDGKGENPTYEDYTSGSFREAVEIEFDPSVVSYDELLKTFFRTVDPTDGGGQFCDRGHAYSTAVYTTDQTQMAEAEKAKAEAGEELGKQIATEIKPAPKFWDAEGYHQDYYKKNPFRYKYYRFSCGRDKRVEQLWGKDAHYGIGS